MTVVDVFAGETSRAAERKRGEDSMNHRWHWMPQTEVKNMKQIRRTLCLLMFSAIATLALAASARAQTVVVGTGNPDLDVPAVQAAVDQGGEVILKGRFSFDSPPTVPTAPELAVLNRGFATVLVSGRTPSIPTRLMPSGSMEGPGAEGLERVRAHMVSMSTN